jgi:adenylate kinase
MRLLLLGAPGSGKGTQARCLASHYRIAHLATGDLLRHEVEQGTALGVKVEGMLAAGDLVPDDLIEDLLFPPFMAASREGGYVLDGFPRTVHQAERAFEFAKEAGTVLQAVIHLDVPHDELLRRALARGQGRADDNEATIRHRLEVYDRDTRPLVEFYAGRDILVTIGEADAMHSPDAVFATILDRLDALG